MCSSDLSGKLRAVSVLGTKPVPMLPGVPPLNDTLRGFVLTNWFALILPSATPVDIQKRLHGELVKIIRAPDFKDRLLAMGAEAVGSSQEQFGAFIKSEMAKWGKVIRDANIKPE
mgnify:CR=1 FL=1